MTLLTSSSKNNRMKTTTRESVRPPDLMQLATGIRAGERAVLARAITLIESKRADHQKVARALVQELPRNQGRQGNCPSTPPTFFPESRNPI